MGSGKPELISRIKGDALFWTTIGPWELLSCMHLNPHHFGIDGAFELVAAGTVYSVVRHMGDNADLAGLALVGAMGDRQAMIGANRSILDEAISMRGRRNQAWSEDVGGWTRRTGLSSSDRAAAGLYR